MRKVDTILLIAFILCIVAAALIHSMVLPVWMSLVFVISGAIVLYLLYKKMER